MGEADERKRSRVEMENLSLLDTNRLSRDLLKRFMEKSAVEKVAKEDLDDEGEIELNLGLSLGGRFGIDKSSTKLARSSSIATCLPTVRDDDAVAPAAAVSYGNSTLMRTSSLPVETEAEWRKRKELQSLRRMEAKRRRSEKQRNLRGDNKEGIEMNLRGKLEREQNLAAAKRLPTLAAVARQAGGINAATAKGKEDYLGCKIQGIGQPASQGSVESQGGSSSSITELESKLAQGSAEASPPSIRSVQEERSPDVGSSGSKMRHVGSKTPGSGMESASNRLDTGKTRRQETKANALEDMPSVFTKGDGPNGRRIDGILYKYGKGEEVRIMCVCHGSFLTPAEFVKHAGGDDVTHPLKHIVIKPSSSPFL